MPIDEFGTPREDHLYAVFDTDEQAEAAMHDLTGLGVQGHRLRGPDAARALRAPADADEGGGLLAMIRRVLRGVSVEAAEADRYADHLDRGRVVLALPAEERSLALVLARAMTRHGGYDLTFFDNWTYEHLSPAENARHGLALPHYTPATGAGGRTPGATGE